jgi:hypothetical protein
MTIQNKIEVAPIKENRLYYIDFIKSMSIILVIINHATFIFPDIVSNRQLYLFHFWNFPDIPMFMLVFGVLSYKSYKKQKYLGLIDLYRMRKIGRKLNRFIIPYLMAFPIIAVNIYFLQHKDFSISHLISSFFTGGNMTGGYYILVIFFSTLTFPIIFYLYEKSVLYCGLLCFIITAAYVIVDLLLENKYNDYFTWAILPLFFTFLGMFFWQKKEQLEKNLLPIIFFIFGFLFLFFLYSNSSYVFFPFTRDVSTTTSYLLPCSFYVFGILYFFYWASIKIRLNRIFKLRFFRIVSDATFHIYIVQGVYFSALLHVKSSILDATIRDKGFLLQETIALFICLFIGVCFYYFENFLRKKYSLRVKVSVG